MKRSILLLFLAAISLFGRSEEERAAELKKRVVEALQVQPGATVASPIPSAHHGAQAAIYLLKGSALLIVDIDGFAPGGAEEHLPQVRNLVRNLSAQL